MRYAGFTITEAPPRSGRYQVTYGGVPVGPRSHRSLKEASDWIDTQNGTRQRDRARNLGTITEHFNRHKPTNTRSVS